MFKENLAPLFAFDPGPSPEEIMKKYQLKRIIKLDSNENVYGASPQVGKALAQTNLQPARYPDCRNQALREALSVKLGVNENQFLFGLGLDEIIVLISRAFLDSASGIVMAWPTFYEYYSHAQIEGAETKKVPCDASGTHDLDAMLEAIDEKTKLVWICNPNNPTGTCLPEHALRHFIERVPANVIILIDEAYLEFTDPGERPDVLAIQRQYRNVLVLRTFSKAYGLASFRLGYAIGDPRLINELEKVRPPFNNPQISQIAALAALSDEDFLHACVQKNKHVRDWTMRALDQQGIAYYPTQTNFIFVKTEHAAEIAADLRTQGILINPFAHGLRITLGTKEEMEELVPLLAKALQKQPAEEI
ncbi:MAG: histidinol-phosphate transaminase [Sporolactobacillus sp.]